MIVTTTVNNTKYSHHQKKVKGCVGHLVTFYRRPKLLQNFAQDQKRSKVTFTQDQNYYEILYKINKVLSLT